MGEEIEDRIIRYAEKRKEVKAVCDGFDENWDRQFYFIVGRDFWSDALDNNLNLVEKIIKRQYSNTKFRIVQYNLDKSDTLEDSHCGTMIWERAAQA